MKKKFLSLLLALVMCLSLSVPAWAEVLEEANFSENTSQSNDTAASYLIQSQGIDEYESIVSESDFWYDNLPTYSGATLEKTIDISALSDVDRTSRSISSSLSRSAASVQIARLSASRESQFSDWEAAELSAPIPIYSLDGSIYAHAYGIVDENSKLVGYMVAGACASAPPVMEYSYDPVRFVLLQQYDKVYFSCLEGFFGEKEDTVTSFYSEEPISMEALRTAETEWRSTEDYTERLSAISNNWTSYEEFAVVADAQLKALDKTDSTSVTASSSQDQTRAAGTSLFLSTNTPDHTWLTLCSYTVMSMYFDTIGRKIDPALMGTSRPHSIELNFALHDEYGHNPTFSQIAENALDWANSHKLSSSITFTKYIKKNARYTCFTQHKTQINKDIPTMVGYDPTQGDAHIMLGIGYTSDNYYIVRDTWTDDGYPLNSTFYSQDTAYNYYVLGLDYSVSNSSTAWGNVTLREGDSNINVRRLKIMLTLLYYNPGTTSSSIFDAQTTNAVKAFQADNGLVADGVVGSATYAKLKNAHIMCYDGRISEWRTLQIGKSGDDVAQLQLRLYCMGLLTGDNACDGVFGTATETAVKAYQTQKGLTADGVVGAQTFAKLYGTNNNYDDNILYNDCAFCPPTSK